MRTTGKPGGIIWSNDDGSLDVTASAASTGKSILTGYDKQSPDVKSALKLILPVTTIMPPAFVLF